MTGDYGPNYRDEDPETSREAAEETARREVIRIQLLRVYADQFARWCRKPGAPYEEAGLTDEEAMQAAKFDLADDGHRRRCTDLRQAGLIQSMMVGGRQLKRRSERTGKNRLICNVTHAGLDVLEGKAASYA